MPPSYTCAWTSRSMASQVDRKSILEIVACGTQFSALRNIVSFLPFLLLSCSFILHGNSKIRGGRCSCKQQLTCAEHPRARGPSSRGPDLASAPRSLFAEENQGVPSTFCSACVPAESQCVGTSVSEEAVQWVSSGPVIGSENGEGPTLPSVVAASGHPPRGQASWIPSLM